MNGIVVRAPVPTGSVVDLVCEVRETSAEEINSCLWPVRPGPLGGHHPATPRTRSSRRRRQVAVLVVFDSRLTMCQRGHLVKVVAWYDNEWGYRAGSSELAAKVAAGRRSPALRRRASVTSIGQRVLVRGWTSTCRSTGRDVGGGTVDPRRPLPTPRTCARGRRARARLAPGASEGPGPPASRWRPCRRARNYAAHRCARLRGVGAAERSREARRR